jgi:hypothetical protein
VKVIFALFTVFRWLLPVAVVFAFTRDPHDEITPVRKRIRGMRTRLYAHEAVVGDCDTAPQVVPADLHSKCGVLGNDLGEITFESMNATY